MKLATRAIEPSFGLLFGDLLRDLKVETLGAAIIMSTYDVMMNFSGLFVGPLLKEFSYRKVAIAGSLLCSMGLALTSPANSMAHILATYSVINGKFSIRILSFFDNVPCVHLNIVIYATYRETMIRINFERSLFYHLVECKNFLFDLFWIWVKAYENFISLSKLFSIHP